MNAFQRAVVALALVGFVGAAWLFRWDVVAVARGGDGNVAAAYQLDRWTGNVLLLWGVRYAAVTEREAAP